MPEHRTQWQTDIIEREQWINLVGFEAAGAIEHGASGVDIMRAVDAACERMDVRRPEDGKAPGLNGIARAAAKTVECGVSPEHIKNRVAASLWQRGYLPLEQLMELTGLSRDGFRTMCDEMVALQREALRLTVDPETFVKHYR
jgi:hypothetical protein